MTWNKKSLVFQQFFFSHAFCVCVCLPDLFPKSYTHKHFYVIIKINSMNEHRHVDAKRVLLSNQLWKHKKNEKFCLKAKNDNNK